MERLCQISDGATTPVNKVVGHTLRLALELKRPVHVCVLTTQFAYALIGFPVSKSGRNEGSGTVPTGKVTRFFKDHDISYHLGSTLQYKAGTDFDARLWNLKGSGEDLPQREQASHA